MTDSYHFQIEPEPRAEVPKYATWLDDYRARLVEGMNKLVELQFPSGAALQIFGDRIVGRVAPEPIRPALDWNTATPFDPFGADFIVTKGEVPTAPLHTSPTTDSAYPAIAGLLRG